MENKEYQDIIASLAGVSYEDTVPFLIPIRFCKVIKVYDGDTITVAAHIPVPNSPLYRFSVRLNGIDTPEIKSKIHAERELAQTARTALSEMILGKVVELRDIANEKYGRILANVYLGPTCVNEWLIENGYAIKYTGGTKERPPEWNGDIA